MFDCDVNSYNSVTVEVSGNRHVMKIWKDPLIV